MKLMVNLYKMMNLTVVSRMWIMIIVMKKLALR
jgi:hypothetical protein